MRPELPLARRRRFRLFERRTIWWPTWLGAFCVILSFAFPAAWWFVYGESFLSLTNRLPAEVLVVEGWIGPNGVRAAASEFRTGGYRYVVATGSQPDDRGWQKPGWSYAEGAADELAQLGIPADEIIVAPARNAERERTYESAVAVWRKLHSLCINPKSINVFTRGPHARRSRLVFAKVYAQHASIGVVSWVPLTHAHQPWWRSSDRAKQFLTETTGYLFECMANSGRSTNPPESRTSLVNPDQAAAF
jgi:uncharacterized SAM-binding protein YcdF (DUF218 family)